jgi:hypothetical protein
MHEQTFLGRPLRVVESTVPDGQAGKPQVPHGRSRDDDIATYGVASKSKVPSNPRPLPPCRSSAGHTL